MQLEVYLRHVAGFVTCPENAYTLLRAELRHYSSLQKGIRGADEPTMNKNNFVEAITSFKSTLAYLFILHNYYTQFIYP